jgi:hypothetical protein
LPTVTNVLELLSASTFRVCVNLEDEYSTFPEAAVNVDQWTWYYMKKTGIFSTLCYI